MAVITSVSGVSAHAAMVDLTDPTSTSQSDVSNENTPSEIFPLLSTPLSEPVIRSEARTPEDERRWQTLRTKILADFGSRMTPEFTIPEGLRERASFWFDVYTRYGDAEHIVHHVRFPWVIYRVIDTTETLLHSKGPLWLRRDRGEKMAKAQAAEIRATLKRLAARKSYDHLPPLERELFEKLKVIPGPRRQILQQAAGNVRSQLGQRDFFERGLVNSSRYLLYMEEEFKLRGLPTELTRVPFVESSFNEAAFSRVGASGVWQIMPRTGKSYMLVTPTIDERNSPLKATIGAARLLRSYYKATGTWALAITGYNNGIGNIQKAIKNARSRDLTEIIARYHRGDFKFASSNYFTCFLAALYAEKYNELIFKDVQRTPLQERDVVRLAAATRPRAITRLTGLSFADLLKYNLDLKGAVKIDAALPRGYQLHLPAGAADRWQRKMGRLTGPVVATTSSRERG